MITLYQLPPAFDLPYSVSPFCAKLEAYLRLAGVEYETRGGDPRRSPSGKVPYVEFEGETHTDSQRIIEWCKERFGDPLDGEITEAHHRLGHLVRRTLEEHLYWALLHSRFVDDGGWEQQRGVVADLVPAPLRPLVPGLVRRSITKALHAQGLGRHEAQEIYRRGLADLDAVLAVIGDQPFLLGDAPTSYDCCVWAMAAHVLLTPSKNDLTAGARKMPELIAYADRMNERLGFA